MQTQAAPPPSAVPVDHLADKEILEGNEKAFGVVLPRGMHVDHAFVDVIYASADLPPDAVSNYLRARLVDGKVNVGARSTVFDHAKMKGAAPDLELELNVEPQGMGGCKLSIRNATPVKAPVLPDEESRWRAAGLKPNGEPLDPKQLQ